MEPIDVMKKLDFHCPYVTSNLDAEIQWPKFNIVAATITKHPEYFTVIHPRQEGMNPMTLYFHLTEKGKLLMGYIII